MISEIYVEDVESEPETCDSDESQDDPSFDILEETQSRFSNLSLRKKSKSRIPVKVVDDVDCVEIVEPEFDANDQKSYEIVQKIIEVGQVEKLKVEQCKLYLRKHGLRLTGKKDILIDRIKEHISIVNGEGEHKYPASSFVMNCKGDACTGDIVMFEQNVYEMFSIASRSATGPPCGTRVAAGRIVKESYGAAKQQHTFTVEVLWSKGVKPLPPLHPLLIKGRNLYRLKTMRQRWEDESERQKILSEKHARGNAARTNREVRIQEKERKKALRENRSSKGNMQNEKQEKKRKTPPAHPINSSRNPTNQDMENTSSQHEAKNLPTNAPLVGKIHNHYEGSYKENVDCNILRNPVRMEPYGPFRKSFQGGQYMDLYPSRGFERASTHHPLSPSRSYTNQQRASTYHPLSPSRSYNNQQRANTYHPLSPSRSYNNQQRASTYHPLSPSRSYNNQQRASTYHPLSPSRSYNNQQRASTYHPLSPSRSYNNQQRASTYHPLSPSRSHNNQQGGNNGYLPMGHCQGWRTQPCRYYAQGRCTYGTNCKFLH